MFCIPSQKLGDRCYYSLLCAWFFVAQKPTISGSFRVHKLFSTSKLRFDKLVFVCQHAVRRCRAMPMMTYQLVHGWWGSMPRMLMTTACVALVQHKVALICRIFSLGNCDVFVCLSLTPYLCRCCPEKVCSSGWAKKEDLFPFWWWGPSEEVSLVNLASCISIFEWTNEKYTKEVSGETMSCDTTSRKEEKPDPTVIAYMFSLTSQ